MMLGEFQCWGVLLIRIRVGQGPSAFAVGAGGGLFGHFFSRLSFLLSFSLSLGDGPIQTGILSQRVVKPKTTNQPMCFYNFKQYNSYVFLQIYYILQPGCLAQSIAHLTREPEVPSLLTSPAS